MTPRAMPAVAYTTGRDTQAGQVKGKKPDEERHSGSPGWGLGARPAPSPLNNLNTAKNAQLLKDGRIVSRRPTRILRNKRENIYI